jgi:hypothetical protein
MKNRTPGFLSDKNISHDSEQFNYIVELHDYLWRFVRLYIPGASGNLDKYIDAVLQEEENLVATKREISAATDKLSEALSEAEKGESWKPTSST